MGITDPMADYPFHAFARKMGADAEHASADDARKARAWQKQALQSLREVELASPTSPTTSVSLLDLATVEDWEQLLASASKAGSDLHRGLVTEVPQVMEADFNGTTPLHFAAQSGRKLCCEALLRAKAMVNAVTTDRHTPLHEGAEAGHSEVVNILLGARASPDEMDRTGWSPLHRAAHFGHAAAINALLEHKATVDIRDNRGWAPIHKAAYQGHEDAITALANGKASLDATTSSDLTPLQIAKEQFDCNPDSMQYNKTHHRLQVLSGIVTRSWFSCGYEHHLFALGCWCTISPMV